MNQLQTNTGAHAANVNAPETGPAKNPPKTSIPHGAPITQRIRALEQEGVRPGSWSYTLHELTTALTEHIAIHFAQGHERVAVPEETKEYQGQNFLLDMNRMYTLLLQGLERPRPDALGALINAINTAYAWGRINGKKEGRKRRKKDKTR